MSIKKYQTSSLLSFFIKWKTKQLKKKPKQTEKGGPIAKCNQENCNLHSYS